MINLPKNLGQDPSLDTEREEALEPVIAMAMTAGERAGWSPEETARALLRLATSNLLAMEGGHDPIAALSDLMDAAGD